MGLRVDCGGGGLKGGCTCPQVCVVVEGGGGAWGVCSQGACHATQRPTITYIVTKYVRMRHAAPHAHAVMESCVGVCGDASHPHAMPPCCRQHQPPTSATSCVPHHHTSTHGAPPPHHMLLPPTHAPTSCSPHPRPLSPSHHHPAGNVLARAVAMRPSSRAPSMSGSGAATPPRQPLSTGIEGAGHSLAPSPPPSKPFISLSAAGGQGDLRSASPSLLSPAASMRTSLAGSSPPPSAAPSGLISTAVAAAQRKAGRPALTLTLPDTLSLSQAALVSPHRHPLAQTSHTPPAQPYPHQVRPPPSVHTSSDGGWQGRLEGEAQGAGAGSGAEKGREERSSKPRLSVGGRPGLSRLSQHKANAVMDALIAEGMEEEEARSSRNSNSGNSGRLPVGALLSGARTRHSVSCSGTGPALDWGVRPTPPPTPPPPAPQSFTSSGTAAGGSTGAVGVAAHRFGALLTRSSTCKGVGAGDVDVTDPDGVGGGGGTGAKLSRSSSCLTLAGMRGGLGGSGKRAALEAAARAAVAYAAAAPAAADAGGAAGGSGSPSPTPPRGGLSPKPPPQPRGGACTTRPARLTDVHGP